MSPKLVGLPGSSSPASSPLPLALSLPAPTSSPLALLPRLDFLAGRDGAAANLPERVVYGPNAFTCFPGDLERSTHKGDLGIGLEATLNGEEPHVFAVVNGEADAYASKPDGPDLTDAEGAGGLGMLTLPNVGAKVLNPKLGASFEVAKGEADEA